MKLSAPLYILKRRARLLSRKLNIPLYKALDIIAAEEGYNSWSLLAMKRFEPLSANDIFAQLKPADMVLLGARPRQGKTMLSLELLFKAMKNRCQALFFTLEYTEKDVWQRLQKISPEWESYQEHLVIDSSDAVSADYIMNRIADAQSGTIAVIDYLQILDQRRDKPDLTAQITALKLFAWEKGLVFVFISQIDRFYDPVKKSCPDMNDIRLPNPLELSLFNKMCFVQGNEIQMNRLCS